MSENTPRKVGRPSVLTEFVKEKIVQLVLEKKTNAQICEIIGINPKTLGEWQKRDQELRITIKEAKARVDTIVEDTLIHRALGYSHPEEKIMVINDQIVRVETTKHYPPDTASMIFWLKNRQPEKWREKTEIEHIGGAPQITITLPSNGREEISVKVIDVTHEQKLLTANPQVPQGQSVLEGSYKLQPEAKADISPVAKQFPISSGGNSESKD